MAGAAHDGCVRLLNRINQEGGAATQRAQWHSADSIAGWQVARLRTLNRVVRYAISDRTCPACLHRTAILAAKALEHVMDHQVAEFDRVCQELRLTLIEGHCPQEVRRGG